MNTTGEAIDVAELMKQQWRTIHFWIGLFVNALLCGVAVGLVPDTGEIHRLVAGVLMLANIYGYGKAVAYEAPRRPWSNDERAARGLPPQQLPPPPDQR